MSIPTVAVLGAGRIGRVVAQDLASGDPVHPVLVDVSATTLASCGVECETLVADLSDPETVASVAGDHSLVIGTLPSAMGYDALKTVIEAGHSIVDVSFMLEDPRDLDALAKEKGVSAVYDCGFAPGLSNIIVGNFANRFRDVFDVRIYVGGLPIQRTLPFQYKAGFAPSDVIEEYTRPSRVVRDGEVVVLPPLGEIELLEFKGVGTVEAFVTDGLRSLVDTIDTVEMVEKTMRWPGHADLMQIFSDTGLFDEEQIMLPDGTSVRPRDVTSALLFPHWEFEPGEPDLTLMRVLVAGVEDDETASVYVAEMQAVADPRVDQSAMGRTTAFPATSVARMVAEGMVPPGVHPPESLASVEGVVQRLMDDLAEREIEVSLFSHVEEEDESAP